VVLEGDEVEPDLIGQHRELDDRVGLIARRGDEHAEPQGVHASS
jgi:hypothetical protein